MNSICIATYNGEKYIDEQLNSILMQIRDDDEVIISDDGSNDGTIDKINAYHDKRITLLKNDTNRHGAIGNFENALNNATGDIIFLADQDDVWLPDKYERMVQALRSCDLVHCNSVVTDENLQPIYSSFYERYHNGKGILKNIYCSTYFGSHMAFRRWILTEALPFPHTDEIGHDLWLGLVAESIGKVTFLQDKLMLYRRHEGAYCGLFEHKRPFWVCIKGRWIILKNLIQFRQKYKRVSCNNEGK